MTPHVTQKEAAARLGVHRNTIANMLDRGDLIAVEVANAPLVYKGYRYVDAASLRRSEESRG